MTKWDKGTIDEFERNLPPARKDYGPEKFQASGWNDMRNIMVSVIKILREENDDEK